MIKLRCRERPGAIVKIDGRRRENILTDMILGSINKSFASVNYKRAHCFSV